jgi:pimeloyl-ACP methyl ester carboxylesterase
MNWKEMNRSRETVEFYSLFAASRAVAFLVFIALLMFVATSSCSAQEGADQHSKGNILLVAGAHGDGLTWARVIPILQAEGFHVAVAPLPLTGLAGDVAATRAVLAGMSGPTILVGWSWGGMVISEMGDDPKVVALVYIAALAPEVGQSSLDLLGLFPTNVLQIAKVDAAGGRWFSQEDFVKYWCQDLPPAEAWLLAADQRPILATANADKATHAAWHNKPTWYQVASKDLIQSPTLQRFLAKRMGATTTEVDASHASPYSRPREVAKLITDAAAKTIKH